jgi:hypothetical protein
LKLASVCRPRSVLFDMKAVADVLARHGGELLPVADLIAGGHTDFDQLMQDAGACVIEATLKASVQQLIGPKCPGHSRHGGLVRFGSQKGIVHLADRGVRVTEGLEEMFTVNRLELPPVLARALCTTNMIESPNSGLRRAIGRVTRWRDGTMVLRWVGRALSDIEPKWRRIDGADLLWILRQNLEPLNQQSPTPLEANAA